MRLTSPVALQFFFFLLTITPSNNAASSLPYHISSLWWWQSDIPVIWIPLSHSTCAVNDKSSHAAPVLRAATSQRCVSPSLLFSLHPFLLLLLLLILLSTLLHPQAASAVSMLSSVSWSAAVVEWYRYRMETDWVWGGRGFDADNGGQTQRWMRCARFQVLVKIRNCSKMYLQILRCMQSTTFWEVNMNQESLECNVKIHNWTDFFYKHLHNLFKLWWFL